MSTCHRPDNCDEDCRCCPQCYTATGAEVCSRTCEHAEDEHEWEEQPGEPPVDVCTSCGATRE